MTMLGSNCSPCCRQRCYALACSDGVSELVITATAEARSGQPWVSVENDHGYKGFFKVPTISFPAVSETIVLDLEDLISNPGAQRPQGDVIEFQTAFFGDFCQVAVRVVQTAYTLRDADGNPLFIAYANETRSASASIGLGALGVGVTASQGWSGMGYATFSNGVTSNFPQESNTFFYSQPIANDACASFPNGWPKTGGLTASLGGYYESVFDNGQFCLIPLWDGTPAPQPGEEYGYMVGFISNCRAYFFGRQIRVAGLDISISFALQ